jgi:hypothetical protein
VHSCDAHLSFVHTLCRLCTLCSQNRTMFRAHHHPHFVPCPHSTLTTSQYHGLGRCGLNGRSSSRLDGQLWSAVEGGSHLCCWGGEGAETCPASGCRTPNQRSPDLPTGRVSTAGLSPGQCHPVSHAWRKVPCEQPQLHHVPGTPSTKLRTLPTFHFDNLTVPLSR